MNQNSQEVFQEKKKRNEGEFVLADIKIYFKAVLIKIMELVHDQQNKAKSVEIDSSVYITLVCGRDGILGDGCNSCQSGQELNLDP